MNLLRLHLILGSLAIALSAHAVSLKTTDTEQTCATNGGTWDAQYKFCMGDTQDKCKARGGMWTGVCMRGTRYCVEARKDARKACKDKSDCEGECLHVGNKPGADGSVLGQCQVNDDPCGCRRRVINGKPEEVSICAD